MVVDELLLALGFGSFAVKAGLSSTAATLRRRDSVTNRMAAACNGDSAHLD